MKIEHRLHPRHAVSEQVGFIVPMLDFREIRHVNGQAEVINRGPGGVCIRTRTPLEAGHVLRIGNYIGMVKWVREDDAHFIAGLMRM